MRRDDRLTVAKTSVIVPSELAFLLRDLRTASEFP
jgi:hypothetical protein